MLDGKIYIFFLLQHFFCLLILVDTKNKKNKTGIEKSIGFI